LGELTFLLREIDSEFINLLLELVSRLLSSERYTAEISATDDR
jgi:hypothetical protein